MSKLSAMVSLVPVASGYSGLLVGLWLSNSSYRALRVGDALCTCNSFIDMRLRFVNDSTPHVLIAAQANSSDKPQ